MWNVPNGEVILTLDSSSPNAVKHPIPFITENSTNNITDWIAENVAADTTVYVDMDDTVAGFNTALATLFGVTNARSITATSAVQLQVIQNNMPGFFAGLSKLPQVDLLLAKFNSYQLLTTDTGLLNGNAEKQQWANSNLVAYPPTGDVLFAKGELVEGYYKTANKGTYATPTSVLIDDTPLYVDQFKNAGGQAFRYIWSEVVSGTLPPGIQLVDNSIVGNPVSQNSTTTSNVTIRVHTNEGYYDREVGIKVTVDSAYSVWNVPSPYDLGRIFESINTTITLPIDQANSPTVELLSGSLPPGMRLVGYTLTGSPFEVSRLTTFKFVLRATLGTEIRDRTFNLTAEGADVPTWVTPTGSLNIGSTFIESYWLDTDNTEFGLYSTISYVNYTVTVAAGTNQYGAGNKYFIAGVSGTSPVLELKEGSTYKFDLSNSSLNTHGLRFSTTANGTWAGGVEYTTGVTVVGNAGSVGAYIEIVVPKGAPTLYYYCINHSGMGNTANTPIPTTYTKQTVKFNAGIPSNTFGINGEFVYDTAGSVYYFKHNGTWKLFNQSQLSNAYGNNTKMVTSIVAPNPLTTAYWFNINPLNHGLDIRLLKFNIDTQTWLNKKYALTQAAPIEPQDNDVWVQYFDNDSKLSFRYYDSDEKQWTQIPYTASILPPTRTSNAYFILDNSKVDFQLQAIDNDLATGDTLNYYIANDDGVLPPGLTLSKSGRISGYVNPILALDADNYDPYGDSTRQQQKVADTQGYDSFNFDSFFYGYGLPSRNPRKLNTTYDFRVTVADDVSEISRQFSIYVVSDDFLRADNTILRSGTGLFNADVTYLRRPLWLTASNLGTVRADNYQTIFIELFDPNYLLGTISYSLKNYNDDGTESKLPSGLTLDTTTGEVAGIIPYQPATQQDYRFTIEATRSEEDLEVFEVNTNVFEDTLAGATNIKVIKISRSNADGLDDVEALRGTGIDIENNNYFIDDIDETNATFDILNLSQSILPSTRYKALTLSQAIIAGDTYAIAYRNNLTQTEIDAWLNKTINYSSTANVVTKVQFLNNYRFVATSGQSIGVNYLAAGIAYQSETLASSIKRALSAITSIAVDQIIVDAIDPASIAVTLPQTALSNNRGILESVFEADDSAAVESIVDEETIQIDFQSAWTIGVNKETQFAIGVNKNTTIKKRLAVQQTEVTSTTKTFTLGVLGNIDSVINWTTAATLPKLGANRISYLKVEATTTLVGANLRYDLISGKLPLGLELKRNGEIVGTVSQFGTTALPGLTTIDNRTTTFDNGTTSLDRKYTFKILARDRFGYSAVSRIFTLQVDDTDSKLYSNVYMQPYLTPAHRTVYEEFINNYTIFDPSLIYRPYDNNFGLQKSLRTLAYAGIEQKSLANFAAAVTQNHTTKTFQFGKLSTAVAKQPGTNKTVYEVVYVELIDPGKPKKGKTRDRATIRTGTNLKVNQVKLEVNDDTSAKAQGQGFFSVATRAGTIVKVAETVNGVLVTKQNSTIITVTTNGVLAVFTNLGGRISVLSESLSTDSSGDPYRIRPNGDPISVDQTAILAGQTKDQYRYISNIDTMRKRIKAIGANEREFLPLWMRTAQTGSSAEIDYITALPLCYTIPGGSKTVKENIENAAFDFAFINYTIDRYILDKASDVQQETYIKFPNHSYNES